LKRGGVLRTLRGLGRSRVELWGFRRMQVQGEGGGGGEGGQGEQVGNALHVDRQKTMTLCSSLPFRKFFLKHAYVLRLNFFSKIILIFLQYTL
jgi:hypothetical protein